MKCPRCGVWTRVLETRAESNVVDRRTRVCGNEHRFRTYEVTTSVYIDGKRRVPALEKGVAARVARRTRDHEVKTLRKNGASKADIAKKVGISEATVRYVLNREGVD